MKKQYIKPVSLIKHLSACPLLTGVSDFRAVTMQSRRTEDNVYEEEQETEELLKTGWKGLWDD